MRKMGAGEGPVEAGDSPAPPLGGPRLGPALGAFLSDAYLEGMAVFLVVFVGGLAEGGAALLSLLLLAAALKAYASGPLREFLGLPRPERPPRALLRSLLGLGAAFALILAIANLAGFEPRLEPFSLGLALEAFYRIAAFAGGRLARILRKAPRASATKE